MNVKHDSVWSMMNIVWPCLEANFMNNGYYMKVVLTCTYKHTMNEKMKLMNENEGF